jgi:hypothetical protein
LLKKDPHHPSLHFKYRPAAVVSFDSADKVVRVEVILDAATGEFIQAAFTGHRPEAS